MEILAPAGSFEQAMAAINSGCNALYGGLKNYSARKRAKNFSIAEYNCLVKVCHEYDVKFYLTLNTLLYTHEINEIKSLFSSKEFQRPDAVIVADLGLIKMLRDCFPEIKLHASTQFGAYSCNDLKYLKELGFDRVVLAREVTMSELNVLIKSSNIDIEVFGYGSQCIAFSGQCLWGGLLNHMSGNRGSCIGMCRDLYSNNNIKGQVMYPQDIDCSGIIFRLSEMGVSSYKIEGRLRKVEEVEHVVREARCFLDNEIIEKDKYIGYLGNSIPVHSMLHLVNPRKKYNSEKEKLFFDSVNRRDILNLFGDPSICFTYEVDKAEDIGLLVDNGIKNIVFSINSYEEFVNVKKNFHSKIEIIYKLPYLDFTGELSKILPVLNECKVAISSISQVLLSKKYNFKIVRAESTINICNSYAVEFLDEMGIKEYVIHPEFLDSDIANESAEQIVFGKIPLGYSRACWGEVGVCHKNCGSDTFFLHNDDKDYDIEIQCNNLFGYRTIYRSGIDMLKLNKNVKKCRVVFSGMSDTDKINIVKNHVVDSVRFIGCRLVENKGEK